MKKRLLTVLACVLCLMLALSLSACDQTGGKKDGVVAPLESQVDLEHLENSTLAVSFKEGAVSRDADGKLQIALTVYDYDLYDMVDVANLTAGKRLVRGGEEVEITSVERDEQGRVIINGGLDQGGFELVTDDNTVFYELGYSDAKSHYIVGEVTLPIADDFVFTDGMDLDSEPKEYDAEIFMEDGELLYFFIPHNTSVVVVDGEVASMNRRYVP